jgi:hypothetical protein
MVKNRCEKYLSQALKLSGNYYLKLQVNPLACQKTPADFLLFLKEMRILIECKETITNYYLFDRLTQEGMLKEFEEQNNTYPFPYNRSYVLIMFWEKNLKNSDTFLISLQEYLEVKKMLNCSKIDRPDCLKYFRTSKTSFKTLINDLLTDMMNFKEAAKICQ